MSFTGRNLGNLANQDLTINTENHQTPLLQAGESGTEYDVSQVIPNGSRITPIPHSRELTPHSRDLTPRMDVVYEEFDANENERKEEGLQTAGFNLDIDEEVPNNTDKSIDFQAQLDAYKKRTQQELPFTLTQVEDAMFIDQYYLMTLEYHYYQNDSQYIQLQRLDESIDENGELVDALGNKVLNKFAIEKYQIESCKVHPMSSFDREDVVNFVDSGLNILEKQRTSKHPTFMKVDPTSDTNPHQKMTEHDVA